MDQPVYARGSMPIAVILLRFDDISTSHPAHPTNEYITSLFSASTTGGLADYYRDISLGNINIDGTTVFGWWMMKYSYYKDSFDPLHNQADTSTSRRGLFVAEARRLAELNGVDLRPFRGGLCVVINGIADGGNDGNRAVIAPIGGEFWGDAKWHYCGQCGMLFDTKHGFGKCPLSGGSHLSIGKWFSLPYNVLGYTGEPGWRRCAKCTGLFNINTHNDGSTTKTCAAGGRHDAGSGADASYPFQISADPNGGFVSRNWKRCVKCHVLVWTDANPQWDTTGRCVVDWGGMNGLRHRLDARLYSICQYFDTFHMSYMPHEFGHSLQMAESWRKRSDKEWANLPLDGDPPKKPPKDHIYGDKWDVMSANNVFAYTAGAPFLQGGPRLTAASLLKMGWLRKNNVERFTAAGDLTKSLRVVLTALDKNPASPSDISCLAVRIWSPYHVYTVEYRKIRGWDRAIPKEAVLIHELRSEYLMGEKGWKMCRKCAGLWCASSSACAGGDVHVFDYDVATFHVNYKDEVDGQAGWKNCAKCRGIWFTLNADKVGACSAGGGHEALDAREFGIVHNRTIPNGAPDWRWCNKCQLLFHVKDNASEAGECPAGGRHNASSSGTYSVSQLSGSTGEWRRCLKCRGLVSDGYGGCVKGGRHSRSEDGRDAYAISKNDTVHPGQEGWRQCNKCFQLVFGLNGPGVCPRGGGHGLPTAAQGNFRLMYGLPEDENGGHTPDWKWCRKCQVLAYTGDKWNSDCAAGGKHDHTGSSNYVLTSFNGDFTYLVGRDETSGFGTEYQWQPGETWKSANGKISVFVDRFSTTTDTAVVSLKYRPNP